MSSVTVPATFPVGNSEVEFEIPGGLTITPVTGQYAGRDYCLMVFVSSPVAKLNWWVTGSPAEDPGATSGYSISNTIFYMTGLFQGGGRINGESYKLAVKGKARVLSPPGAVRFNFGGGEDNRLQVGMRPPRWTFTVAGYDVHYTSASSSAVADDAAASGSNPAAGWVVWTDPIHAGSQQRVITGLTNGLEYRVRVRAKNSLGAGPWTVGKHTVGLEVIRLTPDPDLLTGLTFSDGDNDLPLQPNVANAIGLGGPDTLYAVHVAESVRAVSVTATWTNTSITTATWSAYDANRPGSGVVSSGGWGISDSGTVQSVPLTDGVTRISINVFGTGGTPNYQIYVYQRGDWEAANARLRALAMHGR